MTAQVFVHIIESPSPDDLLNGQTEGRVLSESLKLAQIPHCYNLAVTQNAFHEAVTSRLANAMSDLKGVPILHLSMHGDRNGVELTDTTRLSWEELRNMLVPLTRTMQGKFMICMSSCFSANAREMAMCEEPQQPFGVLIGNEDRVSWQDAAVAYVVFYHLFFRGTPGDKCIQAMNAASGGSNFTFLLGRELKMAYNMLLHLQRDPQYSRHMESLLKKPPPPNGPAENSL